jgi:hypothetical protein
MGGYLQGARVWDHQQGGSAVPDRAAADGRGLLAAFRSRRRDRQRLVCGVGMLPAAGMPWRAAGRDGELVPLAVPDPVPPEWGLACSGQLVDVPPGRYDWIYLLIDCGDGDVSGAQEVWLHYEEAVDPEWLYLAEPGAATRLPVTRQAVLTGLRLPSLRKLRVVAATLVGPLSG